jgi:hypothetical protein
MRFIIIEDMAHSGESHLKVESRQDSKALLFIYPRFHLGLFIFNHIVVVNSKSYKDLM